MVTVTVSGFALRPASESDRPALLEVINADRVMGQPEVTLEMLDEAIHGRSPIDAGWWAELGAVRVDVAETRDGMVVGAVSYARRPRDEAGVILWLHGHEQPAVVDALLDHVVGVVDGCPVVEAFDFATALGLGLEALPARHRPVTQHSLLQRGFVGRDLWRYGYRRLPAPELPRVTGQRVTVTVGHGERTLTVLDADGHVLAETTIGLPVQGIGRLAWISVDQGARGRGLGRALLGSALDVLAGLGAGEVIGYVDDDEPYGERDRTVANRLYDSSGFVEIDRLHSFRLTR